MPSLRDDIFGLAPGEAAVIRNFGGRVTPATLGGQFGPDWNLIVLHHTDCGIASLKSSPDLLAAYFGVPTTDLDAFAIDAPEKSVAVDVAALRANPRLPGGFRVTGLVYDVATGRIDVMVPSALLRP